MSKSSSSRIAIVTGGSSGIGHAIARKLAKEKITVVVADKVEQEFEEENVIYKKCDVSEGRDIDALFHWVTNEVGYPEIIVLNAGQGIRERLSEGDPEKWQKVLQTNLMGPLRMIRAFSPHMLEFKKGNIVFISSVSANKPHPFGGVYAASKTALEVIAETLRLETLPHINVTVVSPGIVETEFFENEISGSHTIEDMGMGSITAEEIADDVLYALSKKPGTSINKIVTRPTLQTF